MLECPCPMVGRGILNKRGARLILGGTKVTRVTPQLLVIGEILDPSSLEEVLLVDPKI